MEEQVAVGVLVAEVGVVGQVNIGNVQRLVTAAQGPALVEARDTGQRCFADVSDLRVLPDIVNGGVGEVGARLVESRGIHVVREELRRERALQVGVLDAVMIHAAVDVAFDREAAVDLPGIVQQADLKTN